MTFVQADAQIHPFEPATFDVAISRTGTMFFGDPAAAYANIAARAATGRPCRPSPSGRPGRRTSGSRAFTGALSRRA